jgi:hypothetical protein
MKIAVKIGNMEVAIDFTLTFVVGVAMLMIP